jgi:carboxyl-terminal processing protease
MLYRIMRIIAWILGCQIAFSALAADKFISPQSGEKALLSQKYTNGISLVPGPDDANITKVTARILERSHYLRQNFNDEISSKLFDRFFEALDNLRLFFLQSDMDEFEQYRTKLDDLILKDGSIAPARAIFVRFMERLHQQYDYVTNLLATEKFAFDTDEKYVVIRKNQPRPKDMQEAKKVWRDRLRYEYLQEKLGIGRPEEIGKLIAEKLEQKKPKQVLSTIEEKMSKEKAQEVDKLVQEQYGKEPNDKIVKAVVEKLERENAGEIVKILNRRYTRMVRALHEYDNDDVLQLYLTALARVYDPHSDYMGRAELENFSIGMKLSLFGIGALLRSEDGFCKIQSLTPNGPAERSKKLKPNDKIIAVAQGEATAVDVVDMKLNKVVELIRGPKNTEVRLTVVPADAPDPSARKVITLVRDEIRLEDQEAKAKLIELPGEGNGRTMRVGVIDLPSFYSTFELEGRKGDTEPKSTTVDVARLIRKLTQEKADGIVLDLRRNGGGSLEEAIRLSGLFIKEGPIVQVKGPEGDPIIEKDPDPSVFYEGPLVVLTSRFSASASEILAGALQDYGRALVVGDSSTHGKGTVQSLLQLAPLMRGHLALVSSNNPGALKITIRKFYRASGESTQLKGVTPDIVLPSIYNHDEVGEASLDNPLPWDTIAPASYDKLNLIQPLLPELRRRSDARVNQDRDFAYLKQEIERFKEKQAEKSVSLNEGQRLKEKQDADDRAKARKKELAARPEPSWKVYEITLKNAEQPGLPAPVAKTNSTIRITSATGTGTNTVAKNDSDESEEHAVEEKVTAVDMTLEEAKRILMDLVTLGARGGALAGPTSVN